MVERFPVTAENWAVTPILQGARGVVARWRRDGRELFYLASASGKDRMMAVPVRLDGGKPAFGEPSLLFEMPPSGARVGFDVSPDGQRFLVVTPVAQTASPAISVLTNWRALLAR